MKQFLLYTFLAGFALLPFSLHAQTSVSGDIEANTTWNTAGSPYTISAEVLIGSGVTLTIEPGVEVRFNTGTSLSIDGTLIADGTESDKILFTSSAASPEPGDWETIRFNNTANVGSVFNYVIVEYGGSGSGGSLISYRTGAYGFAITNSEFRFSSVHGIDLRASSPAISNSIFRDNGGYGVFSDLALNYEVTSSTVVRNTQGGIRIPINSTPTIYESVIDSNGTGIYIDNGAIPEITFNDIRANETGIRVIEAGSVSPVITDNTISDNTTIGVRNDGLGLLTAEYNFWGDKSGPGNQANPSGTGDEVTNHIDYTPWLYGATLPVREITSNPEHNDIWYADSVYYVTADITLPSNYTLTIQPGAVVKFSDNRSMTINGTLIADGTEEDKIFFTSQYDDGVGGDSNEDGRDSQPSQGNWRRLLIEDDSQNSVLNYVDLRYGGYSNGMLYLNSNSVSVTNVLATNSSNNGIYINAKPLAFNNITANNNNNDGIRLEREGSELNNIVASYNGSSGISISLRYLSENITIDNATASNNNHGIHLHNGGSDRLYGLASLTNSTINENEQNGLQVDENGVDQIEISGNAFEENEEYGASLHLSMASGTDAVISSNIFRNNGFSGLRTSSAQIFNNTFEGNEFGLSLFGRQDYLYTDDNGVDGNTFVDNTFNNVLRLEGYRLEGTLSINFPEQITSEVYMFVQDGRTIQAGDTLVIDPGVIVKSGYGNSTFEAYGGVLIAEGTEENPITFTSWRDDSVGGDTDAVDDTVSAKAGDWAGIELRNASDSNYQTHLSQLKHLNIKYAINGIDVDMNNGPEFEDDLDHLTLENIRHTGIRLTSGRYIISNTKIKNILGTYGGNYDRAESGDGIISSTNAEVTIRNSIIDTCARYGVMQTGARNNPEGQFREISNSTIKNCGYYGANIPNTTIPLTLLGNSIENNGHYRVNSIVDRDNRGYGALVKHSGLDSTDVFFTGNTFKNNAGPGIASSAANFIDNHFEANEFGIMIVGKIGHRYTDENGVDGNTFVDNKFNNVVGLENTQLNGVLSTKFPELITSGTYLVELFSTSAIVEQGDTLEIEPGVIIKMGYGSGGNSYRFNSSGGTLIAEGTEKDPIIFTSYRDDSVGGNINAIADTISAQPGDWGGISILNYSDTGAQLSRLGHVNIRYAQTALDIDMTRYGDANIEDELNDLSIEEGLNNGILLSHGQYKLTGIMIKNIHGTYSGDNAESGDGIIISTNAIANIRNSRIKNTARHGVRREGSTYNGASLGIVREISNSIISENGYDGINLSNQNNPTTIQFNKIENNGRHGLYVIIDASSDTLLTISGNSIRNNTGAGILSSRAIIVDDTLEYNGYPIGVTGEISKAGTINEKGNYYEGNYIANNKIDSVTAVYGTVKGVMGGSRPAGYEHNVMISTGNNSDIRVDEGDSLMVEPGTIFKGMSSTDISINGTFLSLGEADNKIVFTSFKDDTFGGDTNRDTTDVVPESGDWAGFDINGVGSDSTIIKNTIIRYASDNIEFYDTEAIIDSSAVSYASSTGIYISSGATPIIRSTDIHHNRTGISVHHNNSNPAIQLNNFYNNTDYSLYQNADTDIIAENNYWGHESGPFVDQGDEQNLSGEGDQIYISNGTVDYKPFLTGRNGILLGDVSENGAISAFDAGQVLQYAVSAIELESSQIAAADVTANGSVSAMDASYILQFVVGNMSGFPGQGKRAAPDYEEAIAINFESGPGYTDMELINNGEAVLYASDLHLIIPNNSVEEVEFLEGDYGDAITFDYAIEKDSIRIALAAGTPLEDEAAIGTLRLVHSERDIESPEGQISFNKFWVNEVDITETMNDVVTSVDELSEVPLEFDLKQNYPNPFNPSTNIAFDLPQSGNVSIHVYNVLGQRVQTLISAEQQAGSHSINWDAGRLSSGTYILRIDFEGVDNQSYSQVRKMMLIK